ncbi:MAG: sigma-70 family RNA polymerase sigma factor [Chloroflexota bacterium]|nr:sigma-70 family RNA polymerase sigma factor [Chloroflexota bacterium]
MNTNDNRALLARAQASAEGFGELFDTFYDRIYAYAYRRVGSREAAEDIAASVFEDALRGIKRVRWQGKPVIAWLYRIAARRVADFYRDTHRDDAALESDVGISDGGLDGIADSEDYAAVRHGLAKLNSSDREIIRLAFFDELSGAEVAARLDCTPNSAYVRLHRALKRLEALLVENGG